MRIYKGQNIASIYHDILYDLYNSPEYISAPRGIEVKEILNCVIEVQEPNQNLYKNEVRSSPEKYIAAELLFYFSGTNKVDFIENYASMWKQLKNEKNEVNSAYGYLIFNEENQDHYGQYEWAIESLKKDKDSRQAFMHFNKPRHQYDGNKDQVCTLVALLHIRKDTLHMTLTMRSNDVILGFMTDYAFFNVLHQQAYLHLKKYYKKLKMGTYTHISHSMHLYAKHYDMVKNMLQHEFEPTSLPELNTSIIKETGIYEDKYFKVFYPVIKNNKIKIDNTDNTIINWSLLKIKE
jgi:thymidylate synthase